MQLHFLQLTLEKIKEIQENKSEKKNIIIFSLSPMFVLSISKKKKEYLKLERQLKAFHGKREI